MWLMSASSVHDDGSCISTNQLVITGEMTKERNIISHHQRSASDLVIPHDSLFGWLVADGWCWFVLSEEYWWLVCCERKLLLAGGS
jgi:hypothetical protein